MILIYNDKIDCPNVNFGHYVSQNYGVVEAMEIFSAYIIERFKRKNRWSGKQIFAQVAKFNRSQQITIDYKYDGNEHVYHRHFYSYDIDDIKRFAVEFKKQKNMIEVVDCNTKLENFPCIQFGQELTKLLNNDHIIKMFESYLYNTQRVTMKGVEYFKITSIKFDYGVINIKYSSNHIVAGEIYGYENDIENIRKYKSNFLISITVTEAKQTPFDTQTKQYHNKQVYNSIDTIVNKNICVIKYVKAGFSPLLSMTVGDYYVVEKTVNKSGISPIDTYSLLAHDKMERKMIDNADKNRISVRRVINENSGRFEEIKIESWIEENDLNSAEIMLMPNIYFNGILRAVHPLSGKVRNCGGQQLLYDGPVTNFETFKNKPGYLKLHENSVFINKKSGYVAESVTKYNNQNIKIQTVKSYDVPQTGSITYTGTIGGEETIEQMEHRINNDITVHVRYKAEPECASDDEYILIN